jgi:hypothetical protein
MDGPDRRCNIVDAESAGQDHAAALRNLRRALPVNRLARSAAYALVQEHGRQARFDDRLALANDRPALHRFRHIERLEIVDVRLQNIGCKIIEYVLPLALCRVAHDGNTPHAFRQVLRRIAGFCRRHPPHGLGEHETHGVGAGTHGRLHVFRLAQAADLHQQAHAATLALPAVRMSLTRPAGSSLRISALPTRARL